MDPSSERKLFQKHTPQKITIRAVCDSTGTPNDFIGTTNGKVNLSVNVAAKLLENLPDMCYVAVEQFSLSEYFGSAASYVYPTECLNITSPLFSNPYQYIPKWSGGGGEYSSIITTIPINSSTYAHNLTPTNSTTTGSNWIDSISGAATFACPTVQTTLVTATATITAGSISAGIPGILTIPAGGVTGTIIKGQILTGTGIPAGTIITTNAIPSGTDTLYNLNNSFTVASLVGAGATTSGTVLIPSFDGAGPPSTLNATTTITAPTVVSYRISYEQNILQNNIGCYVVNKQMLNNQIVPINITGPRGEQMTSVYNKNASTIVMQMTLVFYGLNDDERYSIIPSV
jgi:hypothetical protein